MIKNLFLLEYEDIYWDFDCFYVEGNFYYDLLVRK